MLAIDPDDGIREYWLSLTPARFDDDDGVIS